MAGYVLGNIKRFLDTQKGANVLLLHYPVNPEAPFVLGEIPNAIFIEYNSERHKEIENQIIGFKANVVLCSGWSNSFYLSLLRKMPSTVKKVVCFDNQWKATLKQRILSLLSPLYLLRLFSFAWVPGNPQKTYALKLGFRSDRIFTGLYPADSDFFSELGLRKLSQKAPYPKIMLSVARYIPQKDLPTLWKAFIAANEKSGNKWVLKCIGLGELYNERVQHPSIQHLGFKQPNEMEKYILEAGIYVLPSIDEPWGVAVHEMALSGLPLVLSDKVGAASMFLKSENGFSFEAGNSVQLESVLLHIMQMSDNALHAMAEKSYESGRQLLSENWYRTLLKIKETN